jgi:hypothetical protein
MRARPAGGLQARRRSNSTSSISASTPSTENTRSTTHEDEAPSMSVHPRGIRIVVPSPILAMTLSGPAFRISTRCPSSG